MTFQRKSVQLSLHLPKTCLTMSEHSLNQSLAREFPSSLSTLLGPLMRASFDQIGNGETCATTVAQAIVGLVELALHTASEQAREKQPPLPRLMRAVQDYAAKHLYEDLTPALIAQANNISARTLHRAFRVQAGMSVSQWIKQTRLERCAADLRDPAMRHRSISEIAFTWGFNSAPHFSRVFRQQFERSPREYRTNVLGRGRRETRQDPAQQMTTEDCDAPSQPWSEQVAA
jgi:AraC family transcriptional regulator, positive regulator of tynA and feaB